MPLLEHVFKRYGSSCHAFARGADCGSGVSIWKVALPPSSGSYYQPTRSHHPPPGPPLHEKPATPS